MSILYFNLLSQQLKDINSVVFAQGIIIPNWQLNDGLIHKYFHNTVWNEASLQNRFILTDVRWKIIHRIAECLPET